MLTNQDTCMVDRFSKTTLENKGLQAAVQEVLDFQRQDVIQTQLVFIENAIPGHATQQSLTPKIRCGSFSSFVRSVRAVARILARARRTRQISRLFFRPNCPMSLSSESRRSFSYGRRGGLDTLSKFR